MLKKLNEGTQNEYQLKVCYAHGALKIQKSIQLLQNLSTENRTIWRQRHFEN